MPKPPAIKGKNLNYSNNRSKNAEKKNSLPLEKLTMKKRRQSKLKCRKGKMYRIRRGEFMRKSKLKGAEY